MTKEQQQQLEQLQTVDVDTTKVTLAEPVGGESFQNGGPTEQYFGQTFDQAKMYSPLAQDFMRSPAELMTAPTVSYDYWFVGPLTDGRVAPAECPKLMGANTAKVSLGFGKLWLKDDILREDLIARTNQVLATGKTLMSDNSTANPINKMRITLLSGITQNFEQFAWNGDVEANGFGILGMKTQHIKLNDTTTTDSGADNTRVTTGGTTNTDGRYNKVNYTNDATGKTAFATDLYGRISALRKYGANHFKLYVPIGSGAVVRAALADFEKVSLITQFLNVKANGSNEEGTKSGYFTDYNGNSYVNQFLDVQELDGLANSEAYLYPDTIFGNWTYKYLEYGVLGKPLPGIQTLIGGLNSEMQSITSLDQMSKFIEMCMCNDNRCDILTLSLRWTGQIIAQGVPMATLYNRVGFIQGFNDVDVTTKLTGKRNLSLIS